MMNVKEQFYVYIITNLYNTVLYIGVTSDLKKRIYEHRARLVDGFSKKYNLHKLVYYEILNSPDSAIAREKHLKGSSRQRKVDLIQSMNPEWNDLYPGI